MCIRDSQIPIYPEHYHTRLATNTYMMLADVGDTADLPTTGALGLVSSYAAKSYTRTRVTTVLWYGGTGLHATRKRRISSNGSTSCCSLFASCVLPALYAQCVGGCAYCLAPDATILLHARLFQPHLAVLQTRCALIHSRMGSPDVFT
eukprot:3940443-Rhodomonas_salina.1